MDKIITPASYTVSAIMTIIGGMTINEWLAITGIFVGIATFAINWFYKHKHFKLAEKTCKGDK